VLSSNSDWIPKMLKEFHETPQGGHSGYYRTYSRSAANLFWFGKECSAVCDGMLYMSAEKISCCSTSGLLQALNIPEQVWEEISMDFITGLPKSKGYQTILVVVDRLSKYNHLIPLKHPYSARVLAEIFTREVVCLQGVPTSILNDRDPIFIISLRQELFKLQGTFL